MSLKEDINLLKDFTILYVEDNEYISEILKKILNGYFKKVFIANNGLEGLKIFNEMNPDLILTDIKMPELDGLEMSKKIKRIKPEAQIAVITAFNETSYLKESVNIGISKYILKPLKDDNLLQSLIDMAKKIDYENKKEIYNKTLKLAAMGEMLSNIAHQWRQPLSVISASASGLILERECGLSNIDNENEFLRNIISQTKYLSQTIDDFRDFFIESSKDRIYEEEINLKEVINKVISLTSDSFKSNDVELITNILDYKILKNKNQIIQALINIFNNAKDAFKINDIEDRYFFVTTSIIESKIIIELKDTAGGINIDVIDRIFEPYFTTKHQFSGTGIGLYMTHLIVNKHLSGEITVCNEEFTYKNKKYKGACFRISL